MKTLLFILACSINLAYSSQETDQTNPPKVVVISEDTKISVQNIKNPIIIDSKQINDIDQLHTYIDEYLRKHHDGWHLVGNAMDTEANKYMLWCTIANDADRVITLVFDVSSVFDRLLKSSDQSVREEINKFLSEFKTSSSEISH